MKREILVITIVSLLIMTVGLFRVAAQEKIPLCYATQEQLANLPGMTPELAKEILYMRDGLYTGVQSKFKNPEDLAKSVRGMTKEIADKIAPYLDFETIKGF